jgi:ribosomal protein S7
VYGKACSGVIYRARSITKASKTVVAAEIVYHALNKISFFASSSKTVNVLAKAKVRVSINKYGFIKLRPGLN